MKTLAIASAIVLAAGSAFAGNVEPMVMDAAPMVESPGSGALAWIIPLVAIAAIVIASDD